MQRIKDFFKGPSGDLHTAFIIVLLFLGSLSWYTISQSSLTREERTALAAHRILEIHPKGNPTVVCFVLDNPGRTDSISCLNK
jgi:hypothetical protein